MLCGKQNVQLSFSFLQMRWEIDYLRTVGDLYEMDRSLIAVSVIETSRLKVRTLVITLDKLEGMARIMN